MTDDATRWRALADLLPPAPAQEVMDCWSIGEQELGLDLLLNGLLEHDIPISEGTRARLAVTAEIWGEREAQETRIRRCRPSSDGDPDVRLIAPAEAIPVPSASVSTEQALTGLVVVPWIACVRCELVLGRAHTPEPRGGPSHLAVRYVLYGPGSTPSTIFGPTAAEEALAALIACASSSRDIGITKPTAGQ